jgi:hypothetical protein
VRSRIDDNCAQHAIFSKKGSKPDHGLA